MVGTGIQINNNITLRNTRGFLRKVLTCEKMLYSSLAPIKIVNIYNPKEEDLLPGALFYASALFHQWIYWYFNMTAIKPWINKTGMARISHFHLTPDLRQESEQNLPKSPLKSLCKPHKLMS